MSKSSQDGPSKLRAVRVLSVAEGEASVVRFLGGYDGAIMHYVGGRARPCQGERECPAPIHRQETFWRGWAAVEEWSEQAQVWFPAVLVITAHLEEILRGRALRGEVWALTRRTGKKRGNAVDGLFLEQRDPSQLRGSFEWKSILLRLYNLRDFPLGVRNPTPPRVMLEASTDAPPEGWTAAAPAEDAPATKEEIRRFKSQLKAAAKGAQPKSVAPPKESPREESRTE